MSRQVAAVPEAAVRLRVNGLVVATWTCTPLALEPLAAGRLLALGFIASAEDLLALNTLPPSGEILGVDAEVPPSRATAAIEERDHRRDHACGLRFFVDCRPETIVRDGAARPRTAERDAAVPAPTPPTRAFPLLFRELFERSGSYRTTGGLHAAALSDGAGLLHLHEEVGRHNAVDKAIGDALLEGRDLAGLGLVTTARISGEIASKAARAGLGWMASRSVPTTLAVEIAGVASLPIVARAAGKDARVFVPGEP